MAGEDANGRRGRQAALLFVVSGALGLLNSMVPGMVGYQNNALRLIDLGGIAVGLAGLLVPWDRLPARWTLGYVPVALVLISASHHVGGVPAPLYGVWFLILFAWVGLWHPPKTCLALSPVVAAAYVVPFLLAVDPPAGAVASVGVTLPAGVILGEILARTVAALKAAERTQAEAMELLGKASVTDDLTGLGNRRHGNTLLDSLRPGDAVALLDLDHFKAVNDEHGHARGDSLLQEVGDYLAAAIREGDGVARFGGEEFVVVLGGASRGAAAGVERLLDGWRARRPMTTMSAGWAVHREGVSPAATLAQADRGLYVAKGAGRDRACPAPGDLDEPVAAGRG